MDIATFSSVGDDPLHGGTLTDSIKMWNHTLQGFMMLNDSHMLRLSRALAPIACALFFASLPAVAQEAPGGCGPLGNAFGPFDYRADRYIREGTFQSHAALLNIVEREHFTLEVEALVRGKSDVIGGDIGYTLRAFPNHPRALLAMATLGDREKTDKPKGSVYSVDCWFSRAIAFRPDDNIVRMIYASHLVNKARASEAEQQLVVVANQANKENAFTQLNLGLIYFDLKNYNQALKFAHRALALGLGNPVLVNQLKKVGTWAEPDDDARTKAITPSN